MGKKIELLDCTLRDGAYIVNARFGTAAIRGIILHMQEAGVEIVECGWLKNAEHEEGTTFYHVPSDVEQYLVKKQEGVVYSVMIDWDRYDLKYLPPYDGKSIDAIRVVFPRGKHREAIEIGKAIRKKGYRLLFQAANTLAYTDGELDALAEAMNEVRPESLSVVDTFGAMFEEDLERIVRRLDEKLVPEIKMGFHSHNNQQLSFALSMRFVQMMEGKGRGIIVDASLCGMGRGAGNATTELVAGWLNRKHGKDYDLDVILDAIDVFMEYFQKHYSWGYSTPYFISGMYCTHVNNIAYLTEKHRTRAKDMRNIIASLPPEKRLAYDYDLLEQKYLEHCRAEVDDEAACGRIGEILGGRPVLMLCSGASVSGQRERILRYIEEAHPAVIGINAMFAGYAYDCGFFSNPVRYAYMVAEPAFSGVPRVVTSNIRVAAGEGEEVVGFGALVKQGWKYFDNAGILCLRLLRRLGVHEVALAGFDGFRERFEENYADRRMPSVNADGDWDIVNREIQEMLDDFRASVGDGMKIHFVTESIFK